MWCVAELDAEYLRKMEDVLAVYEKPYRAAEPVVCFDEKPVLLHADVSRRCRCVQAGQPSVTTSTNAVAPLTFSVRSNPRPAGTSIIFPTPARSAAELAPVLGQIISKYPLAKTIHRVMDNLNIRCARASLAISASSREVICGIALTSTTPPSTAVG